MQAIILAAGMGKRLGELTKDNTKCMVKVNGKTLIDRTLMQLSKLNLTKVIIVIGYEGEKLKQYIGNEYKGLTIEYINNPIYDKTNNIYSLSLAKKQLQEDDTLLIESDLIFDDSLFGMVIDNANPNLVLVAKYEPWMDGTMVCLNEDNNIINFVSKKNFKYCAINSYYKTVNIYKFSKEFSSTHYVPFLEAYCKALGNNEYYEQVLGVITMLEKFELKALPLSGQKWYEIDDIQDLDIAETLFAEDDNKLQLYQKRYGGYWRFPSLLDYCYLVNPYFPPQRMIDEMKSSFETLLTQYPSGMEINSLLMAKYFGLNKDYICVGNGAAEIINSLMRILDGKIGIIYPTFEEYPNRRSSKSIVKYIPSNNNFSYTADDLIAFFDNKDINYLLLINPDNPSGNYISKEKIILLIEWAQNKGVKIIIDESFVDFSDDNISNSLLNNTILETHDNLIVIKSISKSYGVPGLRLGVLATADVALINVLKKDISVWNINSFAEYYMQTFGKYETDYKKACTKFIKERNRFGNELSTISYLRVIPTQANYYLCEVIDKFTSTELTKSLLEYNILIKDCGTKAAFKGKNYIRIAIRNEMENNYLISVLRNL
ncbi:Histidinol-phosphate aminotransferase [bioreactor metagenome]|uniref:Histidinol-phosphate aminotransferase n=1 Tax=bioreactor metagenome TaxID=1076179 RepID=A0A644UJZ2_9ZZZZ